jgi:hypothetical protein
VGAANRRSRACPMTPDVGSLRAALDAHFSHSGDCDNTRFGRCTCSRSFALLAPPRLGLVTVVVLP